MTASRVDSLELARLRKRVPLAPAEQRQLGQAPLLLAGAVHLLGDRSRWTRQWLARSHSRAPAYPAALAAARFSVAGALIRIAHAIGIEEPYARHRAPDTELAPSHAVRLGLALLLVAAEPRLGDDAETEHRLGTRPRRTEAAAGRAPASRPERAVTLYLRDHDRVRELGGSSLLAAVQGANDRPRTTHLDVVQELAAAVALAAAATDLLFGEGPTSGCRPPAG